MAKRYSVETSSQDGFATVLLKDAELDLHVSVVPKIGNNAVEFSRKGANYMFTGGFPLAEIKEKRKLCANPLLAPWANRLYPSSFPVDGTTYQLREEVGNLRKDPNGLPIHGLLAFSDAWEVLHMDAVENRAEVTSRLEFWRHPDLMAQWPFAHSLFMTYRLQDGMLEVETVVENYATEAMPIAIGYHPYFQLPSVARDEWQAIIPAKSITLMTEKLTPSGEKKAFEGPQPFPIKGNKLDNIFEDLVRDQDQKSTFSVSGGGKKLSVIYGPQYPVAVVYAPPGQEFICFEPMTGVTNQLNLAAEGKYPALPTAPSRGVWKGSYWIRIDS